MDLLADVLEMIRNENCPAAPHLSTISFVPSLVSCKQANERGTLTPQPPCMAPALPVHLNKYHRPPE